MLTENLAAKTVKRDDSKKALFCRNKQNQSGQIRVQPDG